MYSPAVRDRKLTTKRPASGAHLGQHDSGQRQALPSWHLPPPQLQASTALPCRVLLPLQPPLLAHRDVSPPRIRRTAHRAHAVPSAQAGRELFLSRMSLVRNQVPSSFYSLRRRKTLNLLCWTVLRSPFPELASLRSGPGPAGLESVSSRLAYCGYVTGTLPMRASQMPSSLKARTAPGWAFSSVSPSSIILSVIIAPSALSLRISSAYL